MTKTVVFVICYEDERHLEECIYYISKLHVPKDFVIDICSIKETDSLAEAYDAAINGSNAVYRVYLNQHTLIVNDFFIYDIAALFQENPQAGICGVLGGSTAEKLDKGRVLIWDDGGISDTNYQSGMEIEKVAVLSEILFVAQYDMEWEGEGIISYCKKMREKGYDVVVPYQSSSWCIFDCMAGNAGDIESEYRFLLGRVETRHDIDSAYAIRSILEDGTLSYEEHMRRVEQQAFGKVITGYFWEDFLFVERKNQKYLPANGEVSVSDKSCNLMHIVASFNHAYAVYASVMLQSLYENNPLCQIQVHILQCDLTDEDKSGLERQAEGFGHQIYFYDFDKSLLPEGLHVTQEWSLEAYFRLFMTQMIPEYVERVLYLDVDIIINKPIYDLYFMDMENHEIVGCRDFSQVLRKEFGDKRRDLFAVLAGEDEFVYFNSGMMLVDLSLLRAWISGKDYLLVAEKLKDMLLAPDQDILNLVHWKNTALVDEFRYDIFNACLKDLKAEEMKQYASIIHYAGPKPWMPIDIRKHAHRIWWEYASRTPMASKLKGVR